jgi:hypothetical protein
MPLIYLTRDIVHNGFPYTGDTTWRVSDEDAAAFEELGVVGEAPADEATPAAPATGAPNHSALKAEWVDYAVSQGMPRFVADEKTKDELIAQFG